MNGKKIEKQRAKGKEESEMKRKGLKQKAREGNVDRGRQKARMRQRTSRRGGQTNIERDRERERDGCKANGNLRQEV